MRRTVVLMIAIVFAAVVAQAPWAHVHDHDADHQREHVGLETVHGHGFGRPVAHPQWQDDGPDDVQSLSPGTAVRASTVTPDLTLTRTASIVVAPKTVACSALDPAPRAHGPPALETLSPRAPPASILSI